MVQLLWDQNLSHNQPTKIAKKLVNETGSNMKRV